MLALDFLGVPFARTMHIGVQMAFVGPPMIRIKTREPEGLQQRFELQKDFVFAAPKDVYKPMGLVPDKPSNALAILQPQLRYREGHAACCGGL